MQTQVSKTWKLKPKKEARQLRSACLVLLAMGKKTRPFEANGIRSHQWSGRAREVDARGVRLLWLQRDQRQGQAEPFLCQGNLVVNIVSNLVKQMMEPPASPVVPLNIAQKGHPHPNSV